MFNPGARTHEQIVELLTKAHMEIGSTEARIQSLQQAMELLLYHTQGNERVDEFLETFLSMHVDKNVSIRRFTAHFIEMLCFTRSRFSCSCLEVLVTLLQDSDKQVVVFALRATRVVYKRGLYWISLQQKESAYLPAAKESLQTLDYLLARVVHLITSSNREIFCEAIRCVQVVVLSQSPSFFSPQNQSQLENVGCTCLEDLGLITDVLALDESKLRGQADRLFTALCALLIKRKDDIQSDQMETSALIHAVGVIGHGRSTYTGAAAAALAQLVESDSSASSRNFPARIRNALTTELKRILSSRHCVEWQSEIIPILKSLNGGETSRTTGDDADPSKLIMSAELERMREQIDDSELKLTTVSGAKKAKTGSNGHSEQNPDIGERLMRISDLADGLKVPEESHAVSVCSVRAQSSLELAKVALAMLTRLPKKLDSESSQSSAIQRVNKQAVSLTNGLGGMSVGFDAKIKAIKSMGITVDWFVTNSGGGESQEDFPMEKTTTVSDEPEGVNVSTPSVQPSIDEVSNFGSAIVLPELIQNTQSDNAVFTKLVSRKLNGASSDNLMMEYVRNLLTGGGDVQTLIDLFKPVSAFDVEKTGALIAKVACEDPAKKAQCIAKLKTVAPVLPLIPESLLGFIQHVASDLACPPEARRNALTLLLALTTGKPGLSNSVLDRIIGVACNPNEAIRTDALKLILAKIYKPQSNTLLDWQWTYKDSKCPLEKVKAHTGISHLERLCSDEIENKCKAKFLHALNDNHQANEIDCVWPLLALVSKKPILVHSVFALLIESPGDVSLPTSVVKPFADSLMLLPGDVLDKELEVIAKEYKGVRSALKKKRRNDLIQPILSAVSNSPRGLTEALSTAAIAFSK